jgi:hypothetical protein
VIHPSREMQEQGHDTSNLKRAQVALTESFAIDVDYISSSEESLECQAGPAIDRPAFQGVTISHAFISALNPMRWKNSGW